MKLDEHNADWHKWTLMGALRFNPEIGKLIDLDTIEEAIDDLIAQVKAEERERNAVLIESKMENYPISIFIEPPSGEHGKTVDACSAAAIRSILPVLAEDIRNGGAG